MSTTIESLELEILSSSTSAEHGIDALSQSLTRLKTATKGGLGLTSVTKQLTKLNDALNNINSSSITKIENLARAVQLLQSVKISSSIGRQISEINTALSGVDTTNSTKIADVATALRSFDGVKISSSIGTQITAITTALNTMNIDSSATTKIQDLVATLRPLSEMPKQNISQFFNQLKRIPTVLTELNAVDMDAFKTKILEVTDAVKPLATEMEKVAAGFSAFPTRIQRLIASTERLTLSNKKASLSYVNLHSLLSMIRTGIRTVSNVFSSTISRINNYIENMNLFTVSMGEFAKESKEYAEIVSEVMGIDPGEWMRAQGVFMTISTGFGIASDRAATMSKNLTQLGYDISSFYNISVEDAMDKLKSGLAGELEPLRAIGYDLSQAKLEATALALGIDKSVSSMTQAEKAQLRYYAIMNQVTVAQGDMARTLNEPANQLRILKAQFNLAAQSIGSIFIPALNALLPYLTAILKVIRILADTVASLFGFEMPEVDYKGVGAMANAGENTSDALDNASESAKKLKSYMLGFDELNVINPNEGSSEVEDVLGGFDFELPEYDFLEGVAESRINTIVEEMKKWLGITNDINTWADLLNTRLGDILKLVGLIGAGMLAWKITTTTMSMINTIATILASPYYSITIGILLTITGIVMSIDGLTGAVEDGVDGFNFAEIIGGSLLTTGGAALLGTKIATWIATAFEGSAIANALATAATNLGVGTAGAVGGVLFASIAGIILGIPTFFVGIFDAIKEGLNWLNGVLIPAGATAASAGIGAIIGMLGGPIGAGIGALIGLAVGLVTDLVILIVQEWDKISAWFKKLGKWFDKNVIQPIVGFFKGLWESVSGFFGNLLANIKSTWEGVANWFNDSVVQPIVNFFKPIVEWISTFFYGCWLIIQAVWVVVSTWFNENVIIPVVDFFKGLWESVSGFFASLWKDIVAIWTTVSTWFNTNVITPVVGFFKGVWTSVSGFFSSLWEDIKGVWNTVVTWFSDTIIEPVKTAFEKACEAIGKFFSNLWLGIRQGVAKAMNGVISGIESAINWVIGGINKLVGGFDKIVQWAADVLGKDWGGISLVQEVKFNRITVPTFAEGGFPKSGQTFIARENGIPEMVGTIGRRTAVANNQQIVESVASGVAEANNEQNTLLREQNALLRALLEKDSSVYLDGRELSNSVDKHKREQGRVIIAGGVL